MEKNDHTRTGCFAKGTFGTILFLLSIPYIVIYAVYTFLVELPWGVAKSIVDKGIVMLSDEINPVILPETKSETKSKFQQRLEDAMETTKKVKNVGISRTKSK